MFVEVYNNDVFCRYHIDYWVNKFTMYNWIDHVDIYNFFIIFSIFMKLLFFIKENEFNFLI